MQQVLPQSDHRCTIDEERQADSEWNDYSTHGLCTAFLWIVAVHEY